MADTNTRQGKRTPVTLKIKFKSETLEQFIERYAVDVSQGGIFIRTKEPLAVGTQMKFEFQLRDASPLIAGEGTVVWTRENDPSRPAIAPGMGVRFDKLGEGSQGVLERILAEKAKQAPARGAEPVTKPPMFTDTPTRVAPAPIQDALGVGSRSGGTRRREDSEQTPLPKPMPFHSDADDFDERAFEEATKVRSLDELAAQSAGLGGSIDLQAPLGKRAPSNLGANLGDEDHDPSTATKIMPADELAARRGQGRADSTLADPPLAEPPPEPVTNERSPFGLKQEPDRDSAPGLPSPPEASRPKMLDATPSARSSQPSTPPVNEDNANRTKLGLEPAKAPTGRPSVSASDMSAAPRAAIANEPSLPVAPKRPSSAPIVIGILAVVVAVAGAVWFFVLREKPASVATNTNTNTNTGSGSAVTPDHTGSGSAVVADNTGSGSAVVADNTGSGSAHAMTGSNTATPAGPTVNTVIASSVSKGATVEIVGTDMKGPAPYTAKLEKDKAYKARVTAPGYVAQEIEIKGGQDKAVAKLVAKSHVLSVTTDPPGADIWIDNVSTTKLTPADVELTAAQASRSRIHIVLKRPGYRPADQFLESSAWNDGDNRMTAKVEAKLQVAPKVVTPPQGGTGSGTTTNNNGAGSGATTPSGTGTGSGSAAGTGTGTTGTTGTGTGTGTTGTGTGTTGTGTTGTGTTTPTPTPTPPAPSAGSGAPAPGQTLK